MLAPGTKMGPYEVIAPLGRGGMGEVFRARDTQLNREVAIKALPAPVASDSQRVGRFEREAQLLAALNHPNIGAIYGIQHAENTACLVLELVHGESLATRLTRGPLAVNEAIGIARQIASALEAAHEKGIIHRDIKPANVMLTPDGHVKVLDFGLGKVLEVESSSDVSNSPTMTLGATQAGMILGTAAYMSPEQAKGRAADKRSDIWAFGCVLYEMLTGTRPFDGDDVSETLAAVLKSDPDWSALPGNLPPTVRALVQRCLVKDRRERISDISTAAFLLADSTSSVLSLAPSVSPTIATADGSGWRRIAAFVAVALAAGATAAAAVWWLTRPAPSRVTWLQIAPEAAAALSINGVDRDIAITPDGSRVVYLTTNGNTLVVRRLDEVEVTVVTGIGQPRGPFISPDGQWIGFFDSTTALKKVAITGGPAILLCRIDGPPRGAVWLPDDTIVFATQNATTGLQKVSAAGGAITMLTKPDRAHGEVDHFWPEALPGGDKLLFTVTRVAGGLDSATIEAIDVGSGHRTVVLRGGYDGQYVPDGHMMYGAAGSLRVIGFDRQRLATSGTAQPIVAKVTTTAQGAIDAMAADDGTLIYVPSGSSAATARTMVWVDRQGRETLTGMPPRAYTYPRLSPDGTRVAVYSSDQEADIWIWDFRRQTLTRATFDPGLDIYPAWFPDGQRLLFSSERAGARNVYWQTADGTGGGVHRLTDSNLTQSVSGVTPDGKQAIYFEIGVNGSDIVSLPIEGTEKPVALVSSPADERNAAISPDGRWLAYEANESGNFEIFVRPYPAVNTGHWQVSNAGGTRPLWARNSRELFFLSPAGTLMGVSAQPGNAWFSTSPAKILDKIYFGGSGGFLGTTFDISLDGKQFLMIRQAEQSATPPTIMVVQHFAEDLKRLVK